MKASVFHGPRDIRVENVPDSRIQQPTDAVVRITQACICGSDLWFYRGIAKWEPGCAPGTSGWASWKRSGRRSAPSSRATG